MTQALLSFSLTPVQSFIEAARSVRDLRAGSAILSHLTLTALEACTEMGGSPLFPAQPDSGWGPHIPNLFLVQFADEDSAVAAAESCATAARDRWLSICTTVHTELDTVLNHSAWDLDWQQQVENFWEMQTLVLRAQDTPEVLQAMLGVTASPPSTGLEAQLRAVQALLGAGKLLRRFPGDAGIGRNKCALMGDLEQMGPAGLGQSDSFWQDAAGKTYIGGVSLAKRDRLCAVALVKRFCKLDDKLDALVGGDVPDTASIATEAWWQQAKKAGAETECNAFTAATEKLRQKLRGDGDTDRRLLLADDFRPDALARDTGAPPEAIKDEAAAVERAVGELRAKAKVAGLKAPPRYYAIIAQDGDEMGKWRSGAKTEGQTLDEEFYRGLSLSLQQYAASIGDVVSKHHGYLVYAGGDDGLLMLPLSEALSCARTLRGKFPAFAKDSDGNAPTLSAGMSIVHYQHDLRAAIREARSAERRAKDEGRDALGINLVKRSGGPVELTLSWDMVGGLQDLQGLFAAGLSDRWVPRFALSRPALDGWVVAREVVECLLGQAIRGLQLSEEEKVAVAKTLTGQSCDPSQSTGPGEAEDRVRQRVIELWGQLWDVLDARARRRQAGGATDAEAPNCEQQGFAPAALDTMVAFARTADFLQRGRD